MTSTMYDSDEACNKSPPLVAIKPNYGDKPSTPPFVDPEKEKVADATGQSPPNLPHIAEIARVSPLEPFTRDRKQPTQPPDFFIKKPTPVELAPRPREPEHGAPPLIGVTDPEGAIPYTQAPPPDGIKREMAPRSRYNSVSELRRPSSDFTKHSPELKHRPSFPLLQPIKSPDAFSQTKPPDSTGNTQPLPSIHKALSALSADFGPPPAVNTMPSPYPFSPLPGSAASEANSPYPYSGKYPIAASPYAHISPVSMKDSSTNPSPASHTSFWRAPASEMMSAQTPYEASPMTATSPATSYPTPTEQVGVGMGDRMSLVTQPNGGPVGSYKCTHPGCTAAPFQTQYLLNSHANVHSQDRPHFCPVEGCPRSLGGKGFKRKNEMMRHGLVHNSPGYVCPFCPDQQHKYPRPDNLQRHVRVHHVDKNKDDPILRQVLAQRPLGSARGRKRRMNNTI